MHKRVLIVDNDKDFLCELEETLALSGYEMLATEDPVEALEVAENIPLDVILLDLKMPGKTGFELAHELNHSRHLQNVPILAMTGFYREEYEPLFAECGIKRCLKKPFRPLEVISAIEEVLIKEFKKDRDVDLLG